jgi:hypothetical protein
MAQACVDFALVSFSCPRLAKDQTKSDDIFPVKSKRRYSSGDMFIHEKVTGIDGHMHGFDVRPFLVSYASRNLSNLSSATEILFDCEDNLSESNNSTEILFERTDSGSTSRNRVDSY